MSSGGAVRVSCVGTYFRDYGRSITFMSAAAAMVNIDAARCCASSLSNGVLHADQCRRGRRVVKDDVQPISVVVKFGSADRLRG